MPQNVAALDYTEALIQDLGVLLKSATGGFIRKKASNSSTGNTEPWRDLNHCSSRLLSYHRATEALWEVGWRMPNLFDVFDVTYIPSSLRWSNPLKDNPQKAVDILGRLPALSADDKSAYLELVKSVQQSFDLDNIIAQDWVSTAFQPIVHAEPLVLSWLVKTGGTRPERFFQGLQYIGSSKQACKLCHLYFDSHPSGVQIRSTHGNAYRNWRMPDCADVYGLHTEDEVVTKRREILQGMCTKIRDCILRTLKEKTAEGRPHDSITTSSMAAHSGATNIQDQGRNWVLPRRLSDRALLSSEQIPMIGEELEAVECRDENSEGGADLEKTVG